jgi:hypothetical protein
MYANLRSRSKINIIQKTKLSISRLKFIYGSKLTKLWLKFRHVFDFIDILFIGFVVILIAIIPILYENLLLDFHSEIYSQLFFSAGTMHAGILAITFALSLFSIEQASDKGTPTILELFIKDKKNQVVFAALSLFTLVSFLFGVLNRNGEDTMRMVSCEILFIGSTFILLRFQYKHIARMINPNWQIEDLVNNCNKYLDAMVKYINDIIQLELISFPDEGKQKKDEMELRNSQEAAVYTKIPNLLIPANQHLEQLYAILNKYSIRQEYEVVRKGLHGVSSIINRYIDIRKKSSVPYMADFLVFQTDLDDFLVPNYEKIATINNLAIRNRDVELSKLIIKNIESISLKYGELEPVGLKHERPTNIAVGYLKGFIEECLKADMFDIGIFGSGVLSRIGISCIKRNDSIGIHMAYQDLSDKVAYYGIIKKQNYLVNYALDGTIRIIWAIVFQKKFHANIDIKQGLDSVKKITEWVLTTTDETNMPGMNNIQHSLGSFYDLTKDTAIGILLAKLAEKILKEEDPTKKKELMDTFLKVDKEIWRFFRDIGEIAGVKESFLLHFINMNIMQISKAIIYLCQDDDLDYAREKLLNDLIWYLSVFWWSYDKTKTIKGPQLYKDADLLAQIGMQCINLKKLHPNFFKAADRSASFIKTLALQLMEKGKDSPVSPPSIMVKMCYLGIFAYKENFEALTSKTDRYIADFQKEYVGKFPENKTDLLKQLKKLEKDSYERWHLDSKSVLFKMVSRKDISKYYNHVEDILSH